MRDSRQHGGDDGALMGAYQITRAWQGVETTWMDDGSCRLPLVDRTVFFSDDERGMRGELRVAEAKASCVACSVREECLEYALATKPHGIWGGLTEKERRKVSKARQAALPAAS